MPTSPDPVRKAAARAPPFKEFWRHGELTLPQAADDGGILRAFRDDPVGAPLPTPEHPLWLSANQPHTKLHSQLDCGAHSQASKRQGREVSTMHPAAAAPRRIAEGDIVRLHDEIGARLTSAHLSADPRGAVEHSPDRALRGHAAADPGVRATGRGRRGCSSPGIGKGPPPRPGRHNAPTHLVLKSTL